MRKREREREREREKRKNKRERRRPGRPARLNCILIYGIAIAFQTLPQETFVFVSTT